MPSLQLHQAQAVDYKQIMTKSENVVITKPISSHIKQLMRH